MNSNMMLSVVFVAVLCAILGTEAYCPSEVICTNDESSCENGYSTTSYTKTVNGEICPSGCTHCLPNGKYCPDMSCPLLLDEREGCKSIDKLYVKIAEDRECYVCDVHIC